ncbi:ATP-binding cassette domain-containing protein [Kordiimonas gwangyangensis]|uniref:ATP-binding cassette domain-containing protein n=1 Tax=Kordiimonas gwangyangensis TaxID=288022 RepID=UPI000373E32B|nr:ATP-binding cassette domain-containing protein [Kordiimonas gwangyangensis]
MSMRGQVDIHWRTGELEGFAQFNLLPGITALIGPSGAGKTTLARLITGLEAPKGGTITLDGQRLFDSRENIDVRTDKRMIALVPQDSALFPHMSVYENLSFGCRIDEDLLMGLCERAGIRNLLDARVHEISGGEARRAAIIRAIASAPRLLILDEPMNGLDPKRRREMMALIRGLSDTTGQMVLMITHQAEEMLTVADNAILMDGLRATVHGPLQQVFARPETSELLDLDDAGELIIATISDRQDGMIGCALGGQTLWLPDDGEDIGTKVRLRVLARDVAIAKQRIEGISVINQIECCLVHINKRRRGTDLMLVPNGTDLHLSSRITARSLTALGLKEGDTVYALIKAVAVKELVATPKSASGS